MPQPTNEDNTGQEGSSSLTPKDANTSSHKEIDNNNNINEETKNLGSGLASFFGDLLPKRDEPVGFSTSLSDFSPAKDSANLAKTIGVEYIDGGLSYREWRSKEKDYLTKYLAQRLHPHSETQDENLESSSDNEGNPQARRMAVAFDRITFA